MAKKHEMKKEHHKGKMPHKRAKGGIAGGKEFEPEGEGENEGEEGMKMPKAGKPAHMARKAGGHVKGEKAMHRPDRRARGGATSDADPTTIAGKMSKMPFEAKQAPSDSHGAGTDKD